jgi:2-haloacid dehalogenase
MNLPPSRVQTKTIVFDLGNVLINWNPRNLYRKLFTDPAAMEHFLTHVCTSDWNLEQDRGRSWADAVALLSARHPTQAELIAAYAARWEEMLDGPIQGTVEILRELKIAGRPLYGLTNWSAETFPMARQRFEFLDWFDGIVVSGEVKLVKPDARIYRHLLDSYGLTAGETVFIDDSRANVDGANAVGLTGLHFTSPAALRRDLAAIGVL